MWKIFLRGARAVLVGCRKHIVSDEGAGEVLAVVSMESGGRSEGVAELVISGGFFLEIVSCST